jgi:hypothetical protein
MQSINITLVTNVVPLILDHAVPKVLWVDTVLLGTGIKNSVWSVEATIWSEGVSSQNSYVEI